MQGSALGQFFARGLALAAIVALLADAALPCAPPTPRAAGDAHVEAPHADGHPGADGMLHARAFDPCCVGIERGLAGLGLRHPALLPAEHELPEPGCPPAPEAAEPEPPTPHGRPIDHVPIALS